jgi:hypothetical protein
MKMNRALLVQALKVAQSLRAEFTITKSLEVLAERGLGSIQGERYRIDRQGRKALRQWLHSEGVAWTTPASAFSGDRIEVSKLTINEKVASNTTLARHIRLSPMGGGVMLNYKELPVIDGAFMTMKTGTVEQVMARFLLLVENKAAFEDLSRVAGDFERQGVLAVYRGDPESPYGQQWAREASKRFHIPLAAYMDFDPAGLSMGVQSGANQLLVPVPQGLHDLQGSTHDFRNQHTDWVWLGGHAGPDHELAPWTAVLAEHKAGFTQERLIAHRIDHQWLTLPEVERNGD